MAGSESSAMPREARLRDGGRACPQLPHESLPSVLTLRLLAVKRCSKKSQVVCRAEQVERKRLMLVFTDSDSVDLPRLIWLLPPSPLREESRPTGQRALDTN